jgi:type I restriction enzyme S subunit
LQARRVRGELAITVVDVLSGQVVMAAVLSDYGRRTLGAGEARRDKTRALKQAMMQELLTGRTRLV